MNLVKNCNIIHPHGAIEKFDLINNEETNFGYIGTLFSLDQNLMDGTCEKFIQDADQGIHMHTERHLKDNAKAAIEDAVYDANTLFFIGFGYHPDNLKILYSDAKRKSKKIRTIIKNVYKQSNPNIFRLISEIYKIVEYHEMLPIPENFNIDCDLKASKFVDYYSSYFS